MTVKKQLIAKLKRGIPSEDLAVEDLPAEYREALDEWERASSNPAASEDERAKAGEVLCNALSNFIDGNLATENLPAIKKIAKVNDEIQPDWIHITGFSFDDSNIPMVNLVAQFTIEFKKDLSQRDLENWEAEQDDPLAWCLNFWWSFETAPDDWDGYLDTNDGVTLALNEH